MLGTVADAQDAPGVADQLCGVLVYRGIGLAEATPFAAHLYWAGVQALAPSGAMFLTAAAWQVLWIVLLSLLCLVLWRAGLAKVLREGGV